MQIVKVAYINIDWIKNEKDASTDTAFMYHTNDDSTYAYYDFFKNHAKVGDLVIVPVKAQEIKIAKVVEVTNSEPDFDCYPILGVMHGNTIEQVLSLAHYKNNPKLPF